MKKKSIYALMSAIALAGSVGFSSCSSSDDTVAENNPNYNSVTNEVTAQFVLNVSSATSGNTRQSATTVQKNSNFRGMQDAKLIGLATGNPTYLAPYAGGATVTDWTATSGIKAKPYDLGTLYGATAVDNTEDHNAGKSSRRILQLTLPLATDAMLVYARAVPSGTDEANGKVTSNVFDNDPTTNPIPNPEAVYFDLVSRLGDRETSYNETCNLAALIINRILMSEVGEAAAGAYTYAGHTNVGVLPAISWRGIGKALKDGNELPPLQENLASLYNSITTINPGELRAGSASAVCSMIDHIYETLHNTLNVATPTTDGELNAQRLAEKIKGRVDNYFELATSESPTAFRNIGNATTSNTIINGLVTVAQVMTLDQYNSQFSHVAHGDLMGFPTSFKLPLGAAQLHFNDFTATVNPGFSYKNPSTSLLDLGSTIAPGHYMYPSELLYFDNSSLYVSNAEKVAADYPNGYNTWDTYAWTTNNWTNSAVASTTRSVAVKNNINYGVAMLQTQVALNGTSFNDNRNAIVPTEADQLLTEAEVKGMQLTGIIVGGQNHRLGWNYLAKANETTDWDYAIFDNQIESATIPTGANYTLVFDNYHSGEQAAQTDVLVALEFQNNSGKDFYGKGNLIRQGGKFYLIGKLELGTKRIGTNKDINNSDTAWPTKYPIPPYTAGGASQEITRVFIQDYLTTATFKIGENSLKNAFVTVPDLRSTQTSLGLSVDLNWRSGLNYVYEFQ